MGDARVIAERSRQPQAGVTRAPTGDFSRSRVGGAAADLIRSPGRPLDRAEVASMHSRFGCDFASVRVHADAAGAEAARSLYAHAFTVGNHIAFGAGRYAPGSPDGRRLLAHELAHVLQQRRGQSGNVDSLEREARAAGSGDRALSPGDRRMPGAVVSSTPVVQFEGDRAALRARLEVIQTRLIALRARYNELDESFTRSTMAQRERESVERGRQRLHAQARTESAARELWGGTRAASRIQRAVSAAVSGTAVTLTANLQIVYLALTDETARRQAAIDIPRIEAAVRDVWQVDIATGEYAGTQLRLVPRITYAARGGPASPDAFQIKVRGSDGDPSTGDAVNGVISLAADHLKGSRVIVVAHELAHLFGFVDAYLTETLHARRGPDTTLASVGRSDARNRPDLLGMIDPAILERWHRSAAITAGDVARQTGAVHVWEEDASIVLRTLGVAPPARPRPTPDSDDFDPQVELDRVRQSGEEKLKAIRTGRERADNSIESVEIAEQIIDLENEERDLRGRLGSSP